jgi:hypothetical protein
MKINVKKKKNNDKTHNKIGTKRNNNNNNNNYNYNNSVRWNENLDEYSSCK